MNVCLESSQKRRADERRADERRADERRGGERKRRARFRVALTWLMWPTQLLA